MFRITSRTTVAAVSLVLALAVVTPAMAQKARSRSSSKAKTTRVTRSPRAARSATRIKTRVRAPRRASATRVQSTSRLKSTVRSRAITQRANRFNTTGRSRASLLRVNRSPQSKVITRSGTSKSSLLRVNRAAQGKVITRDATARSKVLTRGVTDATITRRAMTPDRLKRAAVSDTEIKNKFRTRPSDANRGAITDALRTRPERRATETRWRGRRGDGYPRARYRDGYGGGYHTGYHHGYHRGYRDGYWDGHFYSHHHYYGHHRVFGFHFGGFGFYHNRWHFAIVIGSPYVLHHHHYYNYSWWDGRGATLVTWERAAESYPATYTFAPGDCVELVLRTRDGNDYAIKVDPRYWNARDPGDLYAALWAELEETGQLQVEDLNGALHVFPAGMIQQIEARACR